MSLYDDEDTERRGGAATVGAGWSSGIRLLQSQLKLKKAATTTQPKREIRKPIQVLPPVIDLKSKRDDEEGGFAVQSAKVTLYGKPPPPIQTSSISNSNEYDWNVIGEYDPMWPNDYGKMVRELRLQRDRDTDKYDDKDKKSHRKRKSRFGDSDDYAENLGSMQHRHTDEDIDERSPPVARTGGAAIAPPPSLQEPEPLSPPQVQIPSFEKPDKPLLITPAVNYGGNSVAAKIMAKYGFKEGQGLGKKEQGMSMALQVEKTSKRGGRIIHEKDGSIMPPPPPIGDFSDSPIPSNDSPGVYVPPKSEPSITEIMKSPSKVVLLRNMVGSGDVDEELEPEVKDECNSKYGDVIKVIIFEIPEASPDEAVRIFVEFKRIESAIKAVVDLNGRFFGGRQVKAGFYNVEKFANLKLLD